MVPFKMIEHVIGICIRRFAFGQIRVAILVFALNFQLRIMNLR